MTASTTATVPAFQGPVHLPGHGDYDALRVSWNRAVASRPAVVAVATSPDDVAAAVRYAAQSRLPLTVQSTGHGTHVATTGGIVLRTHLMNDVAVDPTQLVARVGAGATWNDVVSAAAAYGLAPLAGVGSVGAVGFTVGGGAGPLARLHGLTADSVVAAEVVTAVGAPRRISPDADPELFWAVRGGGGSFAVVTALEIGLYPIERLWSGLRIYDIATAPEVLAAVDAWAPDAPDATSVALMLMTIPEDGPFPPPLLGRTVVGLRVTHVGDDAEPALKPLIDPFEEPVLDTIAPTTFAEMYASAPPHEPIGIAQHFGFVESLTAGVSDELISAVSAGTASMVEIRHWAGALASPRPCGGATGVLESPFSVLAVTQFDDTSDRDTAFADVARVSERLEPYETGRTFLNFVADPVDVPRAFTPDAYRRLTSVKATWDPYGVIRPGIGIGGAR